MKSATNNTRQGQFVNRQGAQINVKWWKHGCCHVGNSLLKSSINNHNVSIVRISNISTVRYLPLLMQNANLWYRFQNAVVDEDYI